MARCRTMEERIRANGRKSEERERLRWGVTNSNHMIFELPNIKQKAFHALLEYLYTDHVEVLKDN